LIKKIKSQKSQKQWPARYVQTGSLHLYTFKTRKLSNYINMVLGVQELGEVGQGAVLESFGVAVKHTKPCSLAELHR
jgi:hypothetical protein